MKVPDASEAPNMLPSLAGPEVMNFIRLGLRVRKVDGHGASE